MSLRAIAGRLVWSAAAVVVWMALAGCGRAPATGGVAPTPRAPAAPTAAPLVWDLHVATVSPPFVLLADPTAAGGQSVTVPPGAGTALGAVRLDFTVPTAGDYQLWLRCFWGTDHDDACSNSVAVILDGGRPVTIEDGTYRVWHWLPVAFAADRRAPLALTAGPHALLLQNREDGVKFDQVFLAPWTADEFARRVPQGLEPATPVAAPVSKEP